MSPRAIDWRAPVQLRVCRRCGAAERMSESGRIMIEHDYRGHHGSAPREDDMMAPLPPDFQDRAAGDDRAGTRDA